MDIPAKRSDVELLADAIDGNADSFGVLFDRHGKRVLTHVRRQVGGAAEAEDIVAMVFLEAWRARGRIRSVDDSVLPWLLVTSNNLLRNHRRSARRYAAYLARLPAPAVVPDHAERTVEALGQAQHATEVNRAFAQLTARHQDVLTLCVLQEMTVREAADLLGAPASTIKTRLRRAKKHLGSLIPHLAPTHHYFTEGVSR